MDTTQTQDTLARTLAEATPRTGLDRLHIDALSCEGRIDALVASERLIAYAQAVQLQVLAALEAARSDDPLDCTDEEVIAAVRWSPNATRTRLYLAADLTDRFPETLDLLHAGRICHAQAAALADLTSHLDTEVARAVQARVLPRMPQQSVAATRKALNRAVLAADPHSAQKRHQQQVTERRVVLYPEPDGMTTLALYAPAHTGTAMLAAIDTHAKARKEGDTRTLDQRRADTLARLVLGSASVPFNGTQDSDTRVPALVHVTVGIETLLGLSEQPGDLKGYGPITPVQARALAFGNGSVWRRLITAPDGTLLHTDPTTYRPTASVDRLVRLRDRHCRFPGCAMPAQRCDLDHIQPFDHHKPEAGGPTTPENLQALCRHHHRLKTAGAWNVQRTDDGTTVWTSTGTGRTYQTRIPAYTTA